MSKSQRLRWVVWNQGKIIGPKPPLTIEDVRAIRLRLQFALRLRDLAFVNLTIDSELRGSEVVKVGMEDVLLSGALVHRERPDRIHHSLPCRMLRAILLATPGVGPAPENLNVDGPLATAAPLLSFDDALDLEDAQRLS